MNYFLSDELEDLNNYDSHGIRWRMDYPQLKKARTFLWQEVITDPDGFKTVVISGELELPAGWGYYIYNDFMDINEYFQTLFWKCGARFPSAPTPSPFSGTASTFALQRSW